jgi:hypothetical protein
MTLGSRKPASRAPAPSAVLALALAAVMLLPGCAVLRGRKGVSPSPAAPPPS